MTQAHGCPRGAPATSSDHWFHGGVLIGGVGVLVIKGADWLGRVGQAQHRGRQAEETDRGEFDRQTAAMQPDRQTDRRLLCSQTDRRTDRQTFRNSGTT